MKKILARKQIVSRKNIELQFIIFFINISGDIQKRADTDLFICISRISNLIIKNQDIRKICLKI